MDVICKFYGVDRAHVNYSWFYLFGSIDAHPTRANRMRSIVAVVVQLHHRFANLHIYEYVARITISSSRNSVCANDKVRWNSRNLQPRNEIFYAIHTLSDEIICMWVGSLTATTTRRYQLKICKAFTFRVHYVRMTNLFNCVFAKSLSRAQSAYTFTHREKERKRERGQSEFRSFVL